jgi:hypothetical protein
MFRYRAEGNFNLASLPCFPNRKNWERAGFVVPLRALPLSSGNGPAGRNTCPARARPRTAMPPLAVDDSISDEDAPRAERPLFAPDSSADDFWAAVTENGTLDRPLTESEEEEVLKRFPGPIARFLIRRANQVLTNEEEIKKRRGSRGVIGPLMNERGSQEPEQVGEDWYKDYVFETLDDRSNPFDRQYQNRTRESDEETEATGGGVASSDGDGDSNVNNDGTIAPGKTRILSMFTGSPDDAGEQAQLVGYALAGLFLMILAFKLLLAFVQFFVSFTFSFFAIFALSAGIFVFFYLLRF